MEQTCHTTTFTTLAAAAAASIEKESLMAARRVLLHFHMRNVAMIHHTWCGSTALSRRE